MFVVEADLMRVAPQIAALGLLTVLLAGFGFWARHQAMVKDLNAVFATTVFSPIRAEYPSIVTPEQQAEIDRREQELKSRAETAARRWRALAVAAFASSAVCGGGVVMVGRRAVQRRRERRS